MLHRSGAHPPVGVAWLDAEAEEDVVVRFSRSAGLPPPLPDVLGLSLRMTGPDGEPRDLLLSSAGRAPGLRHLLLPARRPGAVGYSSLVPYATPAGPLMVGARPVSATEYELSAARVVGRWRRFARLRVPSTTGPDDAALDLDPVRHPVPGLGMPAGLARLRADGYAASRRGRGED